MKKHKSLPDYSGKREKQVSKTPGTVAFRCVVRCKVCLSSNFFLPQHSFFNTEYGKAHFLNTEEEAPVTVFIHKTIHQSMFSKQ